jgi:hypothetical protein
LQLPTAMIPAPRHPGVRSSNPPTLAQQDMRAIFMEREVAGSNEAAGSPA